VNNLPAKIHKPLDALDGVIDRVAVAEIAEELKQRLNMPNMDLDTEIMLEQVVILTIRMYLSKDTRTKIQQ
jgi:hypothetical protein